ncbi:MAG TPA: histidine phosphatase family protein [Candidatus Limnocylindria bacterium]|nr:histidine phosphatase family protein [Candidatus Limnocylindria bacterium]
MGTLVLVRHATTQASEEGTNLGQRTDAPLLTAGRELARRTGLALKAELESLPFGALQALTSPAARCRQTASLILDTLGRPDARPAADPGLWEIDYGAWEGLSAEQCRRRDPELRARWEADPYAVATPGGESGADVAARAFAALRPTEEWLESTPDAVALVVTHNHVVRLRLSAALGLPMADYRRRVEAHPGAYSLITLTGERTAVRRVNVLPRAEAGQVPGGPIPA